MSRPLRIVIGEDSYLVREGIVHSLERDPRVEVVAAEGDADAVRRAVERLHPDVVVTDIRMPPTGTDEGVRLARELAASHPSVGVVVLSEHAEPAYATELFTDNSRRAYLLKDRVASREMLIEAIEAVARGVPMLDADIVMLTLQAPAGPDVGLASLTEREREVLAVVAEGRSNRAIGEQLSITERAVERHINAIFAKLELVDARHENRRVVAALMYAREQATG